MNSEEVMQECGREKKKKMMIRGSSSRIWENWGVVALVLCILVVAEGTLRFKENGDFKILQISDMHNGWLWCMDILPNQQPCSNANTTDFVTRLIEAEKPDLIAFTGDNIFMLPFSGAATAMDTAFAPAIASGIPWVAILGNHDQESDMNRQQLITYIVGLNNTLTKVNPPEAGSNIEGWGNYNLEVGGVKGSSFENKSALNLYFLDSGDYFIYQLAYDWIKESQQQWFRTTSQRLQREYMNAPNPQSEPAPGLVFFHIPLPEFKDIDRSKIVGDWQEDVHAPGHNSGFFATMVEAGDVKAAFVGHDHVNDFCGELSNIKLCYAGGSGYQTYGKAGWARRARVVLATLENEKTGKGGVRAITSWKRLHDENLSIIDHQVLWAKTESAAGVNGGKQQIGLGRKVIGESLLTQVV